MILIRVCFTPTILLTPIYRKSTDFKSKKIRVNLNQPIKAEVKAESSDVLKTVDEDRKYVIQATIVRSVVFRIICGYDD